MTTLARCCVYSFIILIHWCSPVSAQVVDIPDLNLEKAIRETLELPNGTSHHTTADITTYKVGG